MDKENDVVKVKLAYRGGDYSRTVLVHKDFSLAFLHEVIQESFGWLNYHLYKFVDADGVKYDSGIALEDVSDEMKKNMQMAADVAIGSVLKSEGDKLLYWYDFGDDNEVDVICLGYTDDFYPEEFDSVGPDLIEDSGAFGFTPGIVKLLSGKGRKSAKAIECADWVASAFGKTPESVLREPSASEIHARVWHLHQVVSTALPCVD